MIISLDFIKISFKFGVAALLLRHHCLLIVWGFCFFDSNLFVSLSFNSL